MTTDATRPRQHQAQAGKCKEISKPQMCLRMTISNMRIKPILLHREISTVQIAPDMVYAPDMV